MHLNYLPLRFTSDVFKGGLPIFLLISPVLVVLSTKSGLGRRLLQPRFALFPIRHHFSQQGIKVPAV
jgi:hypothetical protein